MCRRPSQWTSWKADAHRRWHGSLASTFWPFILIVGLVAGSTVFGELFPRSGIGQFLWCAFLFLVAAFPVVGATRLWLQHQLPRGGTRRGHREACAIDNARGGRWLYYASFPVALAWGSLWMLGFAYQLFGELSEEAAEVMLATLGASVMLAISTGFAQRPRALLPRDRRRDLREGCG